MAGSEDDGGGEDDDDDNDDEEEESAKVEGAGTGLPPAGPVVD